MHVWMYMIYDGGVLIFSTLGLGWDGVERAYI